MANNKKPIRKSLNLNLATTSESNGVKKMKRKNRYLLKQLEMKRSGPFGIFNWFRKN